jgi:epoxyqueuosine reductase
MILAMHETNSDTGTNAPATSTITDKNKVDGFALVKKIKAWGHELGFAEIGIASTDVSAASQKLLLWLESGYHGEMDYMAKHANLRTTPALLVPGTLSVISARLNYWQEFKSKQVLADPEHAYISRYALGRDYHKTMRKRLQKLAERIESDVATSNPGLQLSYRVFSDSAPVLEVEFARQSGIAWRGKHSLSLTRKGSWHFLGEIYLSLPLPADKPIDDYCGTCQRCIDACPTKAIVAPYNVDARLCISYLTIELPGSVPVELRPLIGNRIYGCDDCQLCCPWNRFAQLGDTAFAARQGLENTTLAELFAWTEQDFESRLAGSPIRRIGHERWLRNIAVALGNTPSSPNATAALETRRHHPSALVREHVSWALSNIC